MIPDSAYPDPPVAKRTYGDSPAAGGPAPLPENSAQNAILEVLGRTPALTIPPDFAARIAREAARQPRPASLRLAGWGPRLTLGSGALLTLALFLLAPHAVPSLTSLPFDAELILFAELCILLLFAPRLLQRD